MKKILYLFFVFLLIGCGYKPVSHYAKEEIKGLVYVALDVNIESTNDSVLLKDTMNRLIIGHLDRKLTKNQDLADTLVYLSLPHVSSSTLTSDQEGYTKTYRMRVGINVKYKKKDGKMKSFTVYDYSDYTVANGAQLSDELKSKAITDATNRALKKVFTKIALNNLKERQ